MENGHNLPEDAEKRRKILQASSFAFMAGGLCGGYGLFGIHCVQYLYPANAGKSEWQFVCTLDDLKIGEALDFTMPAGAKVVVARQNEGNTEEAFVALSSICPHLGCQVHWEAVKERFFCPCHNGAFDSVGKPIEGPPEKANQHLTRFRLQVEGERLMIEVPVDTIRVPQSEA